MIEAFSCIFHWIASCFFYLRFLTDGFSIRWLRGMILRCRDQRWGQQGVEFWRQRCGFCLSLLSLMVAIYPHRGFSKSWGYPQIIKSDNFIIEPHSDLGDPPWLFRNPIKKRLCSSGSQAYRGLPSQGPAKKKQKTTCRSWRCGTRTATPRRLLWEHIGFPPMVYKCIR